MTPLRFDFLFQEPLADPEITDLIDKLTPAQVLACHGILAQALDLLPEVEVSASHRRQLVGYLLSESRDLVEGTAEAMEGAPGLFPEAPRGAAASLLARQHGADALYSVMALLDALRERAWVLFLLLQGGATKEALARATALGHPLPSLSPQDNLLRRALGEVLKNRD